MDAQAAAGLSLQEAAELSALGAVIDEAARQVRGGDVDPSLLKDLGMTSLQFKDFVEQYSQRLSRIRPSGDETPAGQQAAQGEGPGARRVQAGRMLDEQLLDVRGGEKLSPDQVRQLYESRAAKVSPEYRKAVEDYFRAISEGAAAPAPAPPAPASAPAR